MSRTGILAVSLAAWIAGCSSDNATLSEENNSLGNGPQSQLEQPAENPFVVSGSNTNDPSPVTEIDLPVVSPARTEESAVDTEIEQPETSDTVNVKENLSTPSVNPGNSTALAATPTSLASTSVPPVTEPSEPAAAGSDSEPTLELEEQVSAPQPVTPVAEPEQAPAIDSVVSSVGEFLPTTLQVEKTPPASDISAPAYKASTTENSSGLRLTRVSRSSAFNGNARHQYSKRPAWNANETLMEIGDAAVDADSLAIINHYVPVSTERTWSNLEPDLMFGIRYNPDPNEFAAVNIRTNEYRVVRRFDEHDRCSLGNSEGALTKDDNKIVIVCDERSTGQKVLISYDIAQDRVLATLQAESNYNWAGFSQSGDYIVVENNKYPDSNAHLLVYDQYFQNVRHLGSPGHGDFGVDDHGDEVYVMIRWDVIWYVRLNDGHRVNLSISDNDNPIGHGHISCRNLDRPGWCYFSAGKDSRLGAVRISENNSAVEHWGFHRSTGDSYNAQPKASVNRSGTEMIFTSNWFGGQDISDYVLSIPE